MSLPLPIEDMNEVECLRVLAANTGGGTAPTGNATVGDVASGKTFSSALLNGATGTNTNNATVPNDAPIQPPQAFVDVMKRSDYIASPFYTAFGNAIAGNAFVGKGITSIDIAVIRSATGFSASDFYGGDFSGNQFLTVAVDAMLQLYSDSGNASLSINLSGPNMGVPTPVHNGTPTIGDFVRNADISTIVGNGGSVTCEEYVDRVSGEKETVTYAP